MKVKNKGERARQPRNPQAAERFRQRAAPESGARRRFSEGYEDLDGDFT